MNRSLVRLLFKILGLMTVFIGSQVGAAEISGRILDQDGKPLKKAHALLYLLGEDKPHQICQADSLGHFLLPLPEAKPCYVRLIGVGVSSFDFPVVRTGPSPLELEARLEPKPYFGDFCELRLHRQGAHFTQTPSAPFTLQADGGLRCPVEVVGKNEKYTLSCGNQLLEYPAADDYELCDGDGGYVVGEGYYSVFREPGPRTLALVRDEFPRRTSDTAVRILSSNQTDWNGITAGMLTFEHIRDRTRQSLSLQESYPGALRLAYGRVVDTEGAERPLLEMLSTEKNREAREILARCILELVLSNRKPLKDFSEIESLLKEEIPAASPWWEHNHVFRSARVLAEAAGDYPQSSKIAGYFLEVLRSSLSTDAKRVLVITSLRIISDQGMDPAASELYKNLSAQFSGQVWMAEVSKWLTGRRPSGPTVGHPAPPFKVPLLGEPRAVVSEKTLLGHCYLIDVWATWCGWCVQAMPKFTQLYGKYHASGFEILSLSCDDSEKQVAAFHERRQPMPWLNAWVGQGSGNEAILDALGIDRVAFALPRYLLVDSQGRVVLRLDGGLDERHVSSDLVIEEKLREMYGR